MSNLLALVLAGDALAQDGQVTVPLEVWEQRVNADEDPAPAVPASIRFGSAAYTGSADAAANLVLTVQLQVSLLGDGPKQVPLLGSGVVVRGASVDGRPIPIEWANNAPVWTTDRKGDVTVRVDAVVAPTGPRGALEFDFAVVPTPVTTLDLTFGRPDVRPRVEGALTSEVTATATTSHLVARLGRTDRIALLGLRELGSTEATAARLYAETSHLLAVDEHELELFTVVRYDILYASAQRFEVFVPEGLTVVSATGEGAFSYEVVPDVGGVLVVAETGSAMRNRYELSLELARELPDTATRFALPSVRGVERESGWVGVEAPGRVKLEPIGATTGLTPVPTVQLPEELRQASVSPLLEGFRLQGQASLELAAQPLPEVEARTERIDRVAAHSAVSSNGRVMTEIALTLRNRMRPGLAVRLPEGAELVRATRDGQVVTPSLAASGEIVVPLRRSAQDLPFTVNLLVAQDLGGFGPIGRSELSLPAFDQPAAEVLWTVQWPGGRWFLAADGAEDQTLAGYGHWLADRGTREVSETGLASESGAPDASTHRYWVPAGEVLSLRSTHLPWWLGIGAKIARVLAVVLVVPAAFAVLALRLAALGSRQLRRAAPEPEGSAVPT